MNPWSLGIDFGTSYTVAAVSSGGETRTIDVESNGRDRMPSATFFTKEGEILVGTAAQHQATFAPDRYEPTPKRALGEGSIFLGDQLVEVAELAGAVLRRVYTEACRQQGERTPDELRLTYPADWGDARRAVLIEACERGGLPKADLIPEPVAAAVRIAYQVTPPDHHIAVYDYGGGTFDAAVLLRTADGFEVAGPPVGRDPLGGEDIDQRIIGYVGGLLAEQYGEAWAKLLDPSDLDSRRDAADLRTEVQRAKETLSEVTACQLWVPGIKRDVQITRSELEDLIGDDVAATVDALEMALSEAGVTANDLAGIYLVGGSSRIPLVADMIWRRLGVKPSVQDNPKSVVATGAAAWLSGVAAQAAVATASGAPARAPHRLVLAITGSADERTIAQVLVSRAGAGGTSVRALDEPARGTDTDGLARAALTAQTARTPGFREQSSGPAKVAGVDGGIERRFLMTSGGQEVAMLEQYLVAGDRAFVVNAPQEARGLAESLVLAAPPGAGEAIFTLRFDLEVPAGWSAAERLRLAPGGPRQSVTVEHLLLDGTDTVAAWKQRELDDLMRLPGAKLATRAAVRLFNSLPGEIITVTWRDETSPMITKLGLAAEGERDAFSLTIALPHADQRLFPALAARASLRPPPV
jgi:molecular chaperone DnaK